MRTRDKYDIFSDILKAAGRRNVGSTIAEVTKKASLNPDQAKELIIAMLEIGLLEFNKEKNLKTTTKRWQFVRIYENLSEFIPISSKIDHMSIGAISQDSQKKGIFHGLSSPSSNHCFDCGGYLYHYHPPTDNV
jgi:predicted transcriptional regulator